MDDWKSRLIIKSMLPNYSVVRNRQEPRKLQESGAAKRRQEEDSYPYPGMAEGGYPTKSKRPCLEDVTLSMGVPRAHPSASCTELQAPPIAMNPGSSAMGVAGHSLLLENSPLNGNVMGSPYAVAPPTEMSLKGAPSHLTPYGDKGGNNMQTTVDQELQDLLEELTNIQEPSSAELDLEKILGNKPEEPVILDTSLPTTSKSTVQMPHLESLGSSKEFPPSCSQVPGMSLPMPTSSAGVSYGLPPTSKQMLCPSTSVAQAKNQTQARPPMALPQIPMPQWHHAQQLKVLAASKQGSATKQSQSSAPNWSSLPPPGLSPPYRPVPSPHPPPPPPPFSSQNLLISCMSSGTMQGSSMQASPNALLSSMPPSSSATLGSSMSYAPDKLPSPSLSQQQPQFSQQSSILAHLVSSTIKHPQGHMLTALSTSTPGPSPPYRPEKLASPGLPQQSFTPQCSLVRSLPPSTNPLSQQQQQQQQQQQLANAMFKPMSAISSKTTLNMIMQQGLASASQGAPEPLSFGNTKPLSHFVSEPGPSKMPTMPATPRQASLLHYLQQPTSMPASSATASSTATATLQLQQHDPSTFLLQQVMQQSQRYSQRAMGHDTLPALPRQHGKRTSGPMAMTPEQQQAYTVQQLRQFQAVQEQVIFKRSQIKATPLSSQHMMPPRTGRLPNTLKPGPPQQHGLLSSGIQVPVPSHPVCPTAPMARDAPPGAPLSGFYPRSIGSHHPSLHQLRVPATTLISSAMWMVTATTTTTTTTTTQEISGILSPDQVVSSSIQQHIHSRAVFTPAAMGAPVFPVQSNTRGAPVFPTQTPAVRAQAFPSQPATGSAPVFPVQPSVLGTSAFPSQPSPVPPNLVATRGQPSKKMNPQVKSSFVFMDKKSPIEAPAPVMNGTGSRQQGLASSDPRSPVQANEPPSSVAAVATASATAASYSLGPSDPSRASPEEPKALSPLSDDLLLLTDSCELHLLQALFEGPDGIPKEPWLCDLRLIDDILGQPTAVPDTSEPEAPSEAPLTPSGDPESLSTDPASPSTEKM